MKDSEGPHDMQVTNRQYRSSCFRRGEPRGPRADTEGLSHGGMQRRCMRATELDHFAFASRPAIEFQFREVYSPSISLREYFFSKIWNRTSENTKLQGVLKFQRLPCSRVPAAARLPRAWPTCMTMKHAT